VTSTATVKPARDENGASENAEKPNMFYAA
jgi:hypothetical protein